jgi:pimeloyl-ACP methyl ester carboxylesterase
LPADKKAAKQVRTVDLRGLQVAVEVSGAGEPVLLLGAAGMPTMGWDAVGLRPALVQAGYQVIAPAARGVAPSDAPPPPYSVGDLAADAAGLLEALGLTGVRVVGLSLGGFVTEVLARTRPALVRAAVLLASGGPATAVARLRARAQRDLAAAGALTDSYLTFEDVRAALPPDVLRDDDETVRQWTQMLAYDPWTSRDGRDGQYAAAWDWLEDHSHLGQLAHVSAPCLVLAFEHDPIFPPRCGRLAVQALPHAQMAVIPGAAHGGALTHPAPTCQAVLDFLADR